MPKIFVGESFTVAIISGIGKVWIRGGNHDFPSVLSHCIEIFHWRTLWCFRKILSSKIFMHRRGASRFCRNFLSHRTETKSFVKEPFCFPEIFWYRKKFMDKRGHITSFRRKFLVSQCRKISWASLKCFRKFRVSKNFMHTRGYHVFPSKSFCLTVPKTFVRKSYCFWENFWFQKKYGWKRGYHVFPSKIFCLTVPKKFVGIP